MAEQMTILEAAALAIWRGRAATAGATLTALRDARAALTTLGLTAEQMEQPVGSWVLVPVEPTPEMRSAALLKHLAMRSAHPGWTGKRDPDPVWSAMLSARPGAKEGGA